MHLIILLSVLSFCSLEAQNVLLSKTSAPNLIDQSLLDQAKATQDKAVIDAAVAGARKAMNGKLYTVTSKSILPPSKDKHDYMSRSPYMWPNPNTANHLPYIRKDGQRNPETDLIRDQFELDGMIADVRALARGYYFTHDEAYAARAALLLQTFFLNDETKMNPNMNFAQGTPGAAPGEPWGILEARNLPDVCEASLILADSPSWTTDNQLALRHWFAQYMKWLLENPTAIREQEAPNNHGTWFDFQEAGIAIYLGRRDIAARILESAKTKRIADQIQPDGSLPREQARTRSWMYSNYDMSGFMRLADLGPMVDVDLWHYRAPNGASLSSALNYLIGFTTHPKDWTFKNLDSPDLRVPTLNLLEGAYYFHSDSDLATAGPPNTKDSFDEVLYREAIAKHWQ